MSNVKQQQEQEQDAFLNSLAEELLAMPDREIIDGDDPTKLRKENIDMIAKAKTVAGRRRIASGRAAFLANQSASQQLPEVDVALARAAIQAAINDPQYTLAARSLSDMTDEDILRLYHQMQRLKGMRNKPDANL